MPTDDCVMRLLRENGEVTVQDMCTKCYVPFHMCAQVMQRIQKENPDVRYDKGVLRLDV